MRNGDDRNHLQWLTPAQLARIMSHLDSPLRDMVHLAAVTAMRVSEIVSLKRGDVDLNEGIISFTVNKDGRRSEVILSTTAGRILQKQLDSHASEWVFPDPRTGEPYSSQ